MTFSTKRRWRSFWEIKSELYLGLMRKNRVISGIFLKTQNILFNIWPNSSKYPYSRNTIHACALSRLWLFVTLWIVAHQAPLSMKVLRQEYWSRLPFPPPEDHLDPGMETRSLVSPALTGGFFTTEPPGKPCIKKTLASYKSLIMVSCYLVLCSKNDIWNII